MLLPPPLRSPSRTHRRRGVAGGTPAAGVRVRHTPTAFTPARSTALDSTPRRSAAAAGSPHRDHHHRGHRHRRRHLRVQRLRRARALRGAAGRAGLAARRVAARRRISVLRRAAGGRWWSRTDPRSLAREVWLARLVGRLAAGHVALGRGRHPRGEGPPLRQPPDRRAVRLPGQRLRRRRVCHRAVEAGLLGPACLQRRRRPDGVVVATVTLARARGSAVARLCWICLGGAIGSGAREPPLG